MGGNNKVIAVVTGDVTMDWNLVSNSHTKNPYEYENWSPGDTAWLRCHRGGAALLADVTNAIAIALTKRRSIGAEKIEVLKVDAPGRTYVNAPCHNLNPANPEWNHSFASWTSYSRDKEINHALWGNYNEHPLVYRCDRSMGFERHDKDIYCGVKVWNEPWSESLLRRIVWEKDFDQTNANLIILDDADYGFRDNTKYWPEVIKPENCPSQVNKKVYEDYWNDKWIVLKLGGPKIVEGLLWDHLLKNCPHRMIVVLNIDDLRTAGLKMPPCLSWERTAEDLARALQSLKNGQLQECGYVIVSLGSAGVVLMKN